MTRIEYKKRRIGMWASLKNIPNTTKGILLVVFGSILTLYAFGFLRDKLDIILIIAGVAMVIYGFMILNGPKKVMELVEQAHSKKK